MGLFDGVQNAYYSFIDKIEPYTGINEWFVNPLESKGVPSLPFFVLLILLLGTGVFFLLNGSFEGVGGERVFKVSVSSAGGFIEGAKVKLTVEGMNPFFATTAENGVAVFRGLPESATGVIEVTRDGFDNFIKTIDLSSSVYSIDLSPAAVDVSSSKFLRVFVQNSDGEALSGVRLVYRDPISGESVALSSDATGGASLLYSLEDEVFLIRASADGFVTASFTCLATQTSCTINLKAKSDSGEFDDDGEDGGGFLQEKGDIIVYSQDGEGNALSAKVAVYDADSAYKVSEGLTSEDGPAFMENAAALGTRVYVYAEAGSDYAAYNGFEANDIQTVSETTEFRIVLEKISEVDLSELRVFVVDEDNAPVDGAEVSAFFLDSPEALLATEYTNENGEAVVSRSKDSGSVYLTVYKDGFLPQLVRDVNGERVSVSLISLAAGNNAAVKAIVLNKDEEVVESALVKVFTPDGFNTGVPEVFSLEDGSALFEGLRVDETYRFRAFYGSSKGQSDLFTPLVDEPLEVEVMLEPAVAFILVNAVDATNGDGVAANVSAYNDEKLVSYCLTSVNSSCQLQVPSGEDLVLKATARDYALTTSEAVTLTAGERLSKELKLVPLSFSNRLNVLEFKLEKIGDSSGLNVTSVSPGGLYKAVLTAVLPSGADYNGLYLRVGEKANAGEDFAYFTFFNQPAESGVAWSSSYNPGNDCTGDLQSQTQGKAKWLDYEFDGKFFGVYSIAAKVFVEPSAELSDKLRFDYRVYSVKNDIYSRKPFDDELNYSRKIPGKDYCYADTYSVSYSVVANDFECNDNACISAYFRHSNSSAVVKNGLSTNVGDLFKLYATVNTFTHLSSPVLKISSDEFVQFLDYDFSNSRASVNSSLMQIPLTLELLDNESLVSVFEDTGFANSKSLLPTQYNKISISLLENNEELVSSNKYVVVNGVAELTASIAPTILYAHEEADLKISVFRKDDGTSVTDARVTLVETQGYPFDGFPNGGNRLQGDGTAQNGENGEYVFKRLRPTSTGLVEVVIERLGFTPLRLQFRVEAKDFLAFDKDPNDLRLSCDSTTLAVSTNLDVDAPVTASFSGESCVSIAGPGVMAAGNNSYSFTVKAGKSVSLLLTPINNSQCFIVFNSVLPGSGSVDSKTAFVSVDCPALNPLPTPTPTPNATSTCSSSNCIACSETECKALPQYCSTNYLTLPNQTKVFDSCTQLPNATSLCTPTNCGACKEQECLSLQQQKKCMPEYYVRTQASGQSGQCSQMPGYGNVPGTGYPNTGYPNTPGSAISPFGPLAPVCREYRQCIPYKAPQCTPANFNFQSIFTRRLAQYHANLLFNPTLKNQQIAREAETKIIYDANGLHVADYPEDKECVVTDKRKIECTRRISSILPTNALAFSLYNQFGDFGAEFALKVPENKKLWNTCYKLSSIDDVTILQKIANVPGDLSELTGISPQQRFHTWVIQFLPKKECVEYYYDKDAGGLGIRPKEGAEEVKLVISPYRNTQFSVEVTLKIDELNEPDVKKYALMFTPFFAPSAINEPEQHAIFVNNVQVDQFIEIDGLLELYNDEPLHEATLDLPSQDVGVTTIQLNKDKKFNATVLVNEVPLSEGNPVLFDPLAYENDLALQCSDDMCCSKKQYDEALEELQAEVNEVYRNILSNVETVYSGNIVDGHVALFNKALDDSIADYLARAPIYQACLALGVDPLADLKVQCAEQLTSPLALDVQGQDFSGIYGDAFTQTACDSELLNYAFGFSQAYGPNFWNAFKARLQGEFTAKSGEYHKKNYVVPIELSMQVAVKQKLDLGQEYLPAGYSGEIEPIQEPAIKILTITAKDFKSPDSIGERDDWINLEGPSPFSILGLANAAVTGVTEPVHKLTGCLAPYLGGVKEDQKLPHNRCSLKDEIRTLANFCADPHDEIPEKPEKQAEDIPDDEFEEQPEEPATEPEITPDYTYGDINLYKNKEDCIEICENDNLPPTEKQVNKNAAYCAETYFAKDKGGNNLKFYKDNPPAGASRYWVCENLFVRPKSNLCVPLRDVYSEATWSPTLCSQSNRCHNDMENSNPYDYTCCLKRGRDCK